MIGHIESYDEERQTGAIKSDDKVYEFHLDDWNPKTSPKTGDDVDFMPEDDGRATSVDLIGNYLNHIQPVKNRYVAGFLAIIFGFIGLHRIYLGFYPIAIAQIALSVIVGFQYGFMWGAVEGGLILGGLIIKDAKGRPLK
ncbi:MAG: TM2 domain-containing protein [Methylococcales bacterium]|nr:TM2 domain-containing protein [Methylococcales bacterium]